MPLKEVLTNDHKRLLREGSVDIADAVVIFKAAALLGRDISEALERCAHCQQQVEDVMAFDEAYRREQRG